MDSRSRRLPFCLSGSRSSYTPSQAVLSSSRSPSMRHSRERVLNNDRFPRASSTYKADLDQQAHLVSSSRDYSSSDRHAATWKLPTSLTSSNRFNDHPSAESSLSSRSKLIGSEGRLGLHSVLLNANDDGDSKRVKLSYSNRGLYSSTSVTRSSNGLSRGTSDKESDTRDSSWSSCRLLSRSSASSSKPLLFRKEQETKNEPSLPGLGERRVRSQPLASSLYQADRVASTYAQGARPKETTYTSSSARESSRNRHVSSSTSHRSPLVHDFGNRTTACFSNGSSTRHSSQEQTGHLESSSDSASSYSSRTPWYTAHLARPEATHPRPDPEVRESQHRQNSRRLLSHFLSRCSSQDSSSGSSSVRSLDDESPSTSSESVDSDEGARMPYVDPDVGRSETTLGSLRNLRAGHTPSQDVSSHGYHSGGLTRTRMPLWREAGTSRRNNTSSGGGSSASWLSPSLRGLYPPVLSRLRRHARDTSAHSATGSQEDYSHPQHFLRRWDDPEYKVSQEEEEEEEDDDEDEEEEEEGAVGLEALGAGRPHQLENETLPELEDASIQFSPRHRVAVYENTSVPVGLLSGVGSQLEDQKDKPTFSRDEEKLRKIKERLLLEDSDEEEGDLCRICQMREESASNPLIQPCRCAGSLQYVHQECIKRWLRSKIGSGTNLEAITTCELCKEKLRLNIDNFDIQELYRMHVQSEYDEFISSGLYLVVLLHFCEQRFSDVLGAVDGAGLFNLVRILHDHMDNLENPHGESDEEVQDNRPSIEFSDLDDDLEEEYELCESGTRD
uniref:E3 ubiquitin-protein ligase MARCHF7 isoform X2 n=1 Tax=Monopterus albus TaxID=43700 RepID=UPI0009B4696D|nr:E3 ubiquitin-protein ligase MARCH7 isoform X2 [Monopterus albus]